MALLEIEGLDVSYGPVVALQQVSLSVERGEIVLVVGANGAGKSTLLNTISGGLRPTAGRMRFDGHDLTRMKRHEIARAGVAHVPEGRGVLGELTVRENLALGVAGGGRRSQAFTTERVLEIFPRLRDRTEQPAVMLSGGEQQMLAIARALLMNPRLLMIDELSLGLAPQITRELLRLLEQIKRSDIGVLIVEQNVKEAIKVADRTHVLANGCVVHEARAGEAMSQQALLRAYLAA